MEVIVLLALLSCLAAILWRWRCTTATSTRRARVRATIQQRTFKIRNPTLAHRALIEHANAFSDRPSSLFPVPLLTGRQRRRSDNILSVPYGPHWRILRCNINSNVLHPSRLGSLAPLQRAAIEDLVAGLSSSCGPAGEVIVRGRLYAAVFALVARMCFGESVSQSDVRAAQHVIQEFVRGVGQSQEFARSELAKLVHWRRWRRFRSSRRRMAEVFLPLVAQRRQSPSTTRTTWRGVIPYVDSLLRLRVPNDDDTAKDATADAGRELTDDEMVSLVSEFLGAGTETVAACVEWALAHLAAQPDVQNKLRHEIINGVSNKGALICDQIRHREMTYLHCVVLESLRMHPPVAIAMRQVRAEEAAEVAGIATVPSAGLRVHFMLGDIGRDSKAWTDPHEFRPERFMPGGEAEDVGPLPGPKEIRMMPFGAGRRFCPGMGLGMLHVKLFLAALVRQFEWTPPAGQNIDLTEWNGFFKTMKKPLRAAITGP